MSGVNEDFDESLWYVGATGCDRANVAFSLYGVLKGDSSSDTSECAKQHYINSFFTVGGLEAWVASMQSNGNMESFSVLSNFGQYNGADERRTLEEEEEADNDDADNEEEDEEQQEEEQEEQEEGEEEEGQEEYEEIDGYNITGGHIVGSYCLNNNAEYEIQDNQDDDAYSYGLANGETVPGFEDATSIGIGCMAGNFRLLQFDGAFCPRSSSDQVLAQLASFNNALRSQECVLIYDSANQENSGGLYLLQESRACETRFSNDCPDPFGFLAMFDKKLALRRSFQYPISYITGKVVGILCFLLGTISMVIAACAFKDRENQLLRRYQRNTSRHRMKRAISKEEEDYYYPEPVISQAPSVGSTLSLIHI